MCQHASDLQGRLATYRQTQGEIAYELLLARLTAEERMIVRMLFELEIGWKDAVFLMAASAVDNERELMSTDLDSAQTQIVRRLAAIRDLLDIEAPLDSAK